MTIRFLALCAFELVTIGAAIALSFAVAGAVNDWMQQATAALRGAGL